MTTLPSLETLIPTETLAQLKNEIEEKSEAAFQPLLDQIVEISALTSDTKVEVKAQAELTLVADEMGNPTVANNVTLDLTFTPERSYDMFDSVHRTIVTEMFRRALAKD